MARSARPSSGLWRWAAMAALFLAGEATVLARQRECWSIVRAARLKSAQNVRQGLSGVPSWSLSRKLSSPKTLAQKAQELLKHLDFCFCAHAQP